VTVARIAAADGPDAPGAPGMPDAPDAPDPPDLPDLPAPIARRAASPIDADPDTDATDAALCPKCGAQRRAGALACTACGLVTARMPAYIAARDAAVPDSVRAAWARVAAGWTEDARHDGLLQLVASHNAYAWAAGRYRTRGQDPMAVRQLERLRRAAEATMFAGATARQAAEAKPYRATSGVLAMLIIAIAAGLLYALVIRDRRPRAAPGPNGLNSTSSTNAGFDPSAPGPIHGAGPLAAPVHPLVPGHPVGSSTIRSSTSPASPSPDPATPPTEPGRK
jgi:hypothetical protein